MEFGKQEAQLLKTNVNGHQLRGIVVDNIQLKSDWNLEAVIQSQDSGMTTVQFDNLDEQRTFCEKRDTLQMIENLPSIGQQDVSVKSTKSYMFPDLHPNASIYQLFAYYPEKFKRVLELDQINEKQFLDSLNSNQNRKQVFRAG